MAFGNPTGQFMDGIAAERDRVAEAIRVEMRKWLDCENASTAVAALHLLAERLGINLAREGTP